MKTEETFKGSNKYVDGLLRSGVRRKGIVDP